MNDDSDKFICEILDYWDKKRETEALTMCAKRKLTEEEIERAMIIGKWFFGWTEKTGPCPIGITNEYWSKKLCALFEWIAVLENEGRKDNITSQIEGEKLEGGK